MLLLIWEGVSLVDQYKVLSIADRSSHTSSAGPRASEGFVQIDNIAPSQSPMPTSIFQAQEESAEGIWKPHLILKQQSRATKLLTHMIVRQCPMLEGFTS